MKKDYFFLLFLAFIAGNLLSQEKSYEDKYLDSLYVISSTFLDNYNYKETIEHSMELVELAKKRKNNYYSYRAHTLLGYSYNDLNDTIRALKHYNYVLDYAKKLDDVTYLMNSYNNLGNIYSENKRTIQKGIDYYHKNIDLAKEKNIPEQLLIARINIAWTYIDNEDYDNAWIYLSKGLEMDSSLEDATRLSHLNFLVGRYYMAKNDLNKAKEYFEKSAAVVSEESLVLIGGVVYYEYSKLLFKEGQYEEAYAALEKSKEYNDKIFQKEKLEQIQIASAKFDVGEYQQDLEIARREQLYKDGLIEKSKERMYIMIAASVVLIIIIILVYRINLSRKTLINELSKKNEELIAAKEEAERLSILKTKFFSTISHELRTPLYGVIGLTSILMDDESLHKHEDDLKSLKFSADYLLALINDVLQMNKMESNLLDLEPVPFNLKDLMKSIVKSFEFTRLQNKNTIHLDLCKEANANLIGDKVRLSQILMNLVGNAMKFTERGEIWIKTQLMESSEKTSKIYFEIKDNGTGISKHNQELIFEEFSQLQSSNYKYQGTGLGLPIVKKLLVLFNSEINLVSEEGEGSTFSFTIEFDNGEQAKDELAQDLQNHELSLESIISSGEKRILVVDDNRINQVVTKRILEQQQFLVELCDNGIDAIERVKHHPFELVLMDVNMPGISGLEATRRIREFNKHLPIIALTAMEIDEIREEIYEAGLNDIIVKPYDTARFYQVIFKNLQSPILT
ncbi:signal transduction histidine kinase [Gillisia sp. Hel_I_86]|uniref:tetratricopeptide repeat-containing hybrid sensor histidine kinase/response regulator n=1 Tax=Gillisia sp. Hel_I_86 TaxID=1249981 RepID=UPI00119A1746|nr:response regulator [Gillisia sp. Hel_I_86]TVZ25437.1 signal transduction histidine kinase [Gillisia sp. Hel_I_86]